MHPIFLYYPMDVPSKQISESPFPIFQEGNIYYFVIPALAEETVQEMFHIGQYFHYYQWFHVLQPVFNNHQQLITPVGKEKYILCIASKKAPSFTADLATFHQIGSMFPYQLTTMNYYGKWKELWIQKLEQHEAQYQKYMNHRPVHPILREYMDFFPYVVGLAENAIQYLTAIEKRTSFNNNDQPTFTFGRYANQLNHDFIYISELVMDHPVRDIAEWIRPSLLLEYNSSENQEMLAHFQTIQLSPFGRSLLFSRLLFPIHIFDSFEKLYERNFEIQGVYHLPLEQFERYEKNLQHFFSTSIEQRETDSIQLDWL